ncbi:MAG: 2,3-bisphosphoglycerate-independent phosphoglycerate mutase [Armatimonadetes bacterium]|nr:2,3-bisphosphoglycerate-independent phosphoglycerate mutase [Anaerolineae bacterium]
MSVKPVMLIILDGWGMREMEHGNAPFLAQTPHYDHWLRTVERSVLDASGEAVGLTPEQMGNSEVGHLNLGAGRVVYQDISAINVAIADGSLAQHPTLLGALEAVKQRGRRLHLLGLVSDGGVHSHIDHLTALLGITQQQGVNPVLHIITDGRDTAPTNGLKFVQNLEAHLAETGHGVIGTLSGRYYAMDRDKRWERTQKAYDALTLHQGEQFASASQAVQASYDAGVNDEFIIPVVIGDDNTLAIKPGDVLLCYNFRADRMRQMVRVFAFPQTEGFAGASVADVQIVTMTVYEDELPVEVLFGKERLKNTLAEVISQAGRNQYHTAETEKYPHVTYFFNGRNEQPYPGEDHAMTPSPKVATYDLQPEMSAPELMEATLARLQSHDDDFILINFANPDMVGHTGILAAAIKACETVDACAQRLVEAVNAKGGVALITADHGNCERMVDEFSGGAHTYHTTSPVALMLVGAGYYGLRPRGILADVAPTVLELLGIPQPAEMTGRSLLTGSL